MADRGQGRGAIVVISGPSGSGKTTLLKRTLAADPELVWSVSATTRRPRRGEVDGRDYWFLTREEFRRRIAAGAFAEHAESFGNLYGTLDRPLREALEAGRLILLDVDIQGVRQVRRKFPEAVRVLIRPPSMEALVERLKKRHTESREQFKARLERAKAEIDCADEFDYVVVNDDLDEAVGELRGLINSIKESRGGKRG